MTGEREKRRHHQWKWDDTWFTSPIFECADSRDLFSCAWLRVALLLVPFACSFHFNDLIIFAFLCKCFFIWKWHFQDLSSRHRVKESRKERASSHEFTVPGSFLKNSSLSETFVSFTRVMRSPIEGYLDANPSLIHTNIHNDMRDLHVLCSTTKQKQTHNNFAQYFQFVILYLSFQKRNNLLNWTKRKKTKTISTPTRGLG